MLLHGRGFVYCNTYTTHLSDLACDVLDTHPSKEQIELLHERCLEMDDTANIIAYIVS